MLTALLISLLTLTGAQKPDSTDTSWLEKEWASTYNTVDFEMVSQNKVHIVSTNGDVVHSFTKSSVEQGTISINKARAYQNADYMFSVSGDDFYLMSGYDIIALPSDTYQYSSAD